MGQGARTAATLAVLCGLVAIGALWGWHAATEPLPAKVDRPICVTTTIAKGEKVFPQQVTVSVYNASNTDGLAARTMQQLHRAGFARGTSGNVTSANVDGAAIWTDDPDSPAVRLVASRLGPKVAIAERQEPVAGVMVVVGDDFKDLVKGRRAMVSADDSQICSPAVD